MAGKSWAARLVERSALGVYRCQSCGAKTLVSKGVVYDFYDAFPYSARAAKSFLRTGQHPARIVEGAGGMAWLEDVWGDEGIDSGSQYLLPHNCARAAAEQRSHRKRRVRAVQPELIA